MSDLIRRQDAIHAIEDMPNAYNGWSDTYDKAYIIGVLEEVPSAEPKTGKCKDCTHWDKLDYEAPRQGWCYQFEEFTDADEYCSRCAMMRGESHE